MQGFFLFLLLLIASIQCSAQGQALSFEALDSALLKQAKKTLIFLHTDWCKYCEAMKQTSFQDAKLKAYLEENYYFVSFDAESRESVLFAGKEFVFLQNGQGTGSHEMALELMQSIEKPAYPALVFLNEKREIIYVITGYLDADEILSILKEID